MADATAAAVLTRWPRRRWLAALVAFPFVSALFTGAAGVALDQAGLAWSLLLLAAGIMGAGILATYVPRSGLRPGLGCSACAAVSGLTVVGAALALGSYGGQLSGPLLAVALTGFGLTQRLRQEAACTTGG